MAKKIIILFLLGIVILTGCLPPQPKAVTAKQNFCSSLYLFIKSVQFLQDIKNFATPTAYQAQLGTVQQSFITLRATASELQDVNTAALDQANTALNEAAQNLPEGVTLEDAAAQLSDEISAVSKAAQDIGISLDCQTLWQQQGISLTPTP